MSRIGVVGMGYVGLTTAACLAGLGHDVVGVDIDEGRLAILRKGKLPIYEPGLEELVERNTRGGRLTYGNQIEQALASAEFVFLAVGTPPDRRRGAGLTALKVAAQELGRCLLAHLGVLHTSPVPLCTRTPVRQ